MANDTSALTAEPETIVCEGGTRLSTTYRGSDADVKR